MKNIKKLYEDVVNICQSHRCDKWRNSWMWTNNGLGYNDQLIYYYLIEYEDDYFFYEDINDLEIKIRENRIDIEGRYKEHYFWEFSDSEWIYVEKYVKELITQQYNSIEEYYKLINLSEEPLKVYNTMNMKLRKDKLKQINFFNC